MKQSDEAGMCGVKVEPLPVMRWKQCANCIKPKRCCRNWYFGAVIRCSSTIIKSVENFEFGEKTAVDVC